MELCKLTPATRGLRACKLPFLAEKLLSRHPMTVLNSAGGSDEMSAAPQDRFWDQANSDCWIRITGGTLQVDAGGDGLDSNGGLYVDGGCVLISGPTSSGDGALDYGSVAEVTGGTVIAAGSAGMASGFGETSVSTPS